MRMDFRKGHLIGCGVRAFAACSLLSLAGVAVAQQSPAYKLVIISGPNGGGVAVVDYPTLARCQKAAATVEMEWKRRFEEAKLRASQEPNTILAGPAFTSFAFCIPN